MKGTCQVCGCTEVSACVSAMGTPCGWIDHQEDLCSECALAIFNDPPEITSLPGAALQIRALRAMVLDQAQVTNALVEASLAGAKRSGIILPDYDFVR